MKKGILLAVLIAAALGAFPLGWLIVYTVIAVLLGAISLILLLRNEGGIMDVHPADALAACCVGPIAAWILHAVVYGV